MASESGESMDTAELFRCHAQFVARFVVRLGVAAQDVEDVVQEVFVIAHRHGGYVAGPARPTTWLAKISMGVVFSRRRTRRRHPEDVSDEAGVRDVAPGANPAEAAETKESLLRVQRAIDQLEPERRAVFVLFELEEESCEQIAAGLGIPIGTVHSRLHTARKEFTAALERIHAAERSRPRIARAGGRS
jgi:RNA polymerase sigma-70 factor (ECF subfamily)